MPTVESDTGSVLVVDDDPMNRKILARNLERTGHRARMAENGLVALEMLQAEPADLVLLDILMPELDGFAVLERIKADSGLRHIPVIMISAVEDVESVVRCIEAGAEDYLPKPFDPVILRARVKAGLNKKRLYDLERNRVRDVFSRFLPESTVDEVLRRTGGEPRLGGVRLTATVAFCDLRGFTAFAEDAPADEVIEVLNVYYGLMSDAILDREGTLKYMGDGIMSVFGAPIEADDHADRAVEAAREMFRERLPAFNGWLEDRGRSTRFHMGIGVCSGPVMSGNVGTQRRLDYAVIGDTANTASRLEAMTKGTPHSVFVAGSTIDLLRGPTNDLVFVDELEVRGKEAKVKAYTLCEQP